MNTMKNCTMMTTAMLAIALASACRAGKELKLDEVKFSHPRDITNLYLPLASLKQDIIEGTEGGKQTRVQRTALPRRHKTFKINADTRLSRLTAKRSRLWWSKIVNLKTAHWRKWLLIILRRTIPARFIILVKTWMNTRKARSKATEDHGCWARMPRHPA